MRVTSLPSKVSVIFGCCYSVLLVKHYKYSHLQMQAPEERNYHIFYCILAGLTAEEKKNLNLGKATDYAFLTKVAKVIQALKQVLLQFSFNDLHSVCSADPRVTALYARAGMTLKTLTASVRP